MHGWAASGSSARQRGCSATLTSRVTSNPTIFERAVAGSDDYDEALRDAFDRGVDNPEELFRELAIGDIQGAADVLRGVYEATGGVDAYLRGLERRREDGARRRARRRVVRVRRRGGGHRSLRRVGVGRGALRAPRHHRRGRRRPDPRAGAGRAAAHRLPPRWQGFRGRPGAAGGSLRKGSPAAPWRSVGPGVSWRRTMSCS